MAIKMKLIYLTSKEYPGRTADHSFIKNMVKSFSLKMRGDFLFVVAGNNGDSLGEINFLNLNLRFKRGRAIRYFLWLPFFYKKQKERVVFFSNDVYLLLILIFWKKVLRLKYKICSDWHQMWGDFRDKIIARNSDYLITTSERLKNNIVKKSGIDVEKILAARGGVDLENFNIKKTKKEIREEFDLPVDKKIIGYAGGFKTMGMEKGIKIMIKALKFLDEKYAMVFIGGKEGEIEEYKKLAEREGVLGRVILKEWQKEEDLLKYEKAMDVLVIPYPDKDHFREWGFPMKVYEYMASGVPIVYSDLEIMKEVLDDCAVSFKAGDEKDLAEKILGIEMKGEGLTKKAREKVKNYIWEKRAEKILEFIRVDSDHSWSA